MVKRREGALNPLQAVGKVSTFSITTLRGWQVLWQSRDTHASAVGEPGKCWAGDRRGKVCLEPLPIPTRTGKGSSH